MKKLLVSALIVTAASTSLAGEFKFGDQTLTLADGFEIELVAGTNLVDRPVSMDFDELGRLYVTISSGSNDKVQKQLEDKPHSVVRLEDTNGDGHFDKKTLFADKMMFPEGCMWHDGSLYVSAPPSIWKLTDTDNDGVADQREEWFQGKTLTGCANDLHGPHLGPDGWIYWCKGAFAEQTHQVNGKSFTTRASHIFRARPDGSRIEPVLTGGMDNPVAIEFTAAGERLLVGTFFVRPEAGKRDGIIHAIYGGVYGKPNAASAGHPRTGELMEPMTHLGGAAPCSVIQYRSQTFGSEFQDNLFVCNFNLNNVTRHVMKPDGATFKTTDSTFLSSDNPDFHPTCVIEDADGSLLVIDTGGWYKICCPTSQLYKPDVLGAIYRIRKTGGTKGEDPRGLKIDWAKAKPAALAGLLADERLYVRKRATQELANRKMTAIPALRDVLNSKKQNAEARRNAVWALTRIDAPKARDSVRIALQDENGSVRLAAIHSASAWRDAKALPLLTSLLKSNSPEEQRAAAEALGRVGDRTIVPALLTAAGAPHGRVLEHSLTYALIEIADAEATSSGIRSPNAYTKRAALIALDQMPNGNLKAEQVAPLLGSKEPVLKQAASWIVSQHDDWGSALAGFFSNQIARDLDAGEQAELKQQLAQFAHDSAIQELLAATLGGNTTSRQASLLALGAIAQSSLKQTPPGWTVAITRLLKSNDKELTQEAVAAARALKGVKESEFSNALLAVAAGTAADEVRLGALSALPQPKNLHPDLFDFLVANVGPAKPVATRALAASVLVRTKWSPEQLSALADSFKQMGPMEVGKLLAAFEQSPTDELGLKLVSALKEAKAFSSLRVEQLKPLFEKFSPEVQKHAETLYASLNTDAEQQARRVDEMLATLTGGDIRRGQAVFNSPKAACSACHSIGYGGGNLGPDLTKIGTIRTERDLLEAIVYPSASFVRSYESIIVVTSSGDDYSGVLRKDAPDEIILGTGPGAEMKIARSEIAEMRPGAVSVMPGGLDEQLTRQELADLIAFLKATRW